MVLLPNVDQFPAHNLTAAIAGRRPSGVDPQWPDDYVTTVTGDVDEVLRALDTLRSDQLCMCNCKKGYPTIAPGALQTARARS
ncbi:MULTISPECIES: alkyl hydroperoxide reductase [unclassified Rhodococcus (in: high G+C Gram-positive bacteria)]|uniref:alkyl hydroperoxide reductase n=1 Tax=unclassified Rhodococcus (in: high G+C Gram-positive bacteria) TaxID=192944 RepID=UPI00163B54F2|nr:alkyl hydroperoxide reductase [Rhodococcus sp. 3A]MBC2897459.1 alkyl hydroperoxide reductase [Rhodococcus sp. 4CII]